MLTTHDSACFFSPFTATGHTSTPLPNKTFAHKTPNPLTPCLEEEHAQMLTTTQTGRCTAFCQEAHAASGPLHIFRPSHTCHRQHLGPISVSIRYASDLQASIDAGPPRGPQNCSLPVSSCLITITVPRLWSTDDMEVPFCEATNHMWFLKALSLPDLPFCPVVWAKASRCHRCKATRWLKSKLKCSEVCDLCVFYGHCHQ